MAAGALGPLLATRASFAEPQERFAQAGVMEDIHMVSKLAIAPLGAPAISR
jgi:hypothetical protein